MASDESDDEPLSVLAAKKQEEVDDEDSSYEETESESSDDEPKRKKKKQPPKKLGVTIKLNRKLNIGPPVIERPADVWLYLKDLNPTGPYSCLLCSDWFINRSKMVLHYALNHKKDFCGICRYFVPDRETWWEHEKFHSPWPCSQCVSTFPSDVMLRNHLSAIHNLVHCRLCHFRVTANDDYNTHLFQKHNVTNVSCQNEEKFWELDYDGDDKFLCLLCSKNDILSSTLFGHFMGYHHFTIKCLTSLVAGKTLPFTVDGAEVTDKFVEDQLKGHGRLGYVDLGPTTFEKAETEGKEKDVKMGLDISMPEVKQEKDDTEGIMEEIKKDFENMDGENISNEEALAYKGEEDFDITLTELIVIEKSYYDYIKQMLIELSAKKVPEISHIDNEKEKSDLLVDIECDLCKTKLDTIQALISHMVKQHYVKTVAAYSCRICATTFDSCSEVSTHITNELGDFEDLWICQFCDKEFDNREATRKHLTEHWDDLDYENCFSPHLGFKCKYCATLFWNEPDREIHQIRVHLNKFRDQFYKCESCDNTFGDKVWYIHHYLENHSTDDEKLYLVKCCLCCVVVSDVDEMRKHFENNHPEVRKLYCALDPCMYKPLSHRKSFKLHVRMLHGQQKFEKAVSCNVCDREFTSARACSTHTAQAHGPGKFKCKLCKEMLQTIDERKLHYLLRHPGRHPFECVDCGKSFQYKSSLYMHRQDHMPNKQSFTCSYCGKIFAKKDSFREHVQIHEGPRHACSYCPMRFVQRSNMLRHERRHTGERPYRCSHCPRSFSDKGACNAHTRTHSKESSYACLYCGQTFVQKSKLTYHIRKHTGENLESCPVCSKLFTSACSLREHMKTHVEKRQIVKCPLCDKGYQDERYMLRHLRTSHTRSQFSCPLCHKLLTSSAGLRHHVITHSPVNTFRCKCCPKSYAVKRTIVKHLRKRHGLKGTELNIKDYFTRLEPRDCQLNLDEITMTSIFGPPKKNVPDILISDFVTFTKQIPAAENLGNNTETEDENDNENSDGKDSESENNSESEVSQSAVKQEAQSDNELEPTDFVSVKIEPIDEENME